MGNCIQQSSGIFKTHPSLGTFEIHPQNGKPCFKLLMDIPTEEAYI